MTIQESVSAAAEEQTASAEKSEKTENAAPAKEKEVEKPAEKTEEKEVEKTKESEKEKPVLEVPETEEQIQQALNIYRTLNNPQTAGNFISDLAKAAGLAINSTEVKLSPKSATQTIVDVLKESLGEENEDLAVKLAPALEKLIAVEVKKPIEQLNYEAQARQVQVEVDTVFEKLTKELPDFTKLQNEMTAMMSNIQPGPKTSMEDYVRTIYKAVGGSSKSAEKFSEKENKNSKISPAKVVEKMVKNAKETKSNVSSDVDEERVTKTSHRPSIREAVLAAAKSLNEQN